MATRSRSLTIRRALATAGKASAPAVVAGGGALGGTLLARWVAARASPTSYAKDPLIPIAAGAVGTLVGGGIPLALMTSTKSKSAAEKSYKATLPMGFIGMGLMFLATTVFPYVVAWFKARAPTFANALSAAPANRQLVGAMVGSKLAMKQLAANGATTEARASGLDPKRRRALEQRAAGLAPQRRAALERGSGRSVRWAE